MSYVQARAKSSGHSAPTDDESGRFSEEMHVRHVAARGSLMSTRINFPASHIHRGTDLSSSWNTIMSDLNRNGVALYRNVSPLSEDTFIAIGNRLGTPMPEHAVNARVYTSQDVILNVISRNGHDASVSEQPFSTHHLRLHTECSRRSVARQPRYLVFLCVSPGSTDTRAQTLIVPMQSVASRLTCNVKSILSRIQYTQGKDCPPILRESPHGPIFSFRDFGPEVLKWKNVSQDHQVNEEIGNAAIQALLEAMYEGSDALGVTWEANDLLILDNRRVFHGRSDASPHPSGELRLIKRLRILSHES